MTCHVLSSEKLQTQYGRFRTVTRINSCVPREIRWILSQTWFLSPKRSLCVTTKPKVVFHSCISFNSWYKEKLFWTNQPDWWSHLHLPFQLKKSWQVLFSKQRTNFRLGYSRNIEYIVYHTSICPGTRTPNMHLLWLSDAITTSAEQNELKSHGNIEIRLSWRTPTFRMSL